MKSTGLSENTPKKDLPLGIAPKYLLALRDYRPAEVAKSLPMPMLVLQAGRDYQVTAKDFEIWQSGLRGKANATLKVFPKLNHLFIAGEGPCKPEEYAIEGHVDAEVVDTIALWIKAIK